jgi:hypothetical protein
MSTDENGALRGLSDQAAGEELERLGYPHYRVRSLLAEARQARSVTLEQHLITLEGDGFRIETLGSRQAVVNADQYGLTVAGTRDFREEGPQ